MFNFLKDMWVMGRINEDYLKKRVEKKQITQEEYDKIVAMPHLEYTGSF